MNAIDKETVLSKTHYGLGIYIHILKQYYPNEVLKVVGRECGIYRNPFNSNKKTLHIFIYKERITGSALDKEFARHEDTENAIPAGDALTFAELHYKQQGDELLQTLNKELYLHIGEEQKRYRTPNIILPSVPKVPTSSLFSFFKAPITNTIPHKTVGVLQIYNAIKGNYYQKQTQELRAISDIQQARKYKAANFDYCTFSGVFTTRNDRTLVKHSGLLCIDFDHLPNLSEIRKRLLADEYFDTQLLFISPSGDGLKWIISIDTTVASHGDYFAAIANYIKQTYNLDVDKSGRDISRACFLPHDPQAYINPNLITV